MPQVSAWGVFFSNIFVTLKYKNEERSVKAGIDKSKSGAYNNIP